MTRQPINDPTVARVARKVADALRVVVLDESIQRWLAANDPKALEQAVDALKMWNLYGMDHVTEAATA